METKVTPENVQQAWKEPLTLRGKATDHIWTMEDGAEPSLIGLRLDSGDSGVVYFTQEQAIDAIECLLRHVDAERVATLSQLIRERDAAFAFAKGGLMLTTHSEENGCDRECENVAHYFYRDLEEEATEARAALSQAQQALRRAVNELQDIRIFALSEKMPLRDGAITSIEAVIDECRAALPSDTPGAQAQGWISVEERMPTDAGYVLIASQGNVDVAIWRSAADEQYWELERSGSYNEPIYLREEVTHWQPLPAPPE